MKILYAPWRQSYNTQSKHKKNTEAQYSCPFCTHSTSNNDSSHLIIKRYKHVYLCMNKYPYNGGHLLAVPYEHQKDLSLLPIETAAELMQVTQEAIAALKKSIGTSDFNIGINMGKAAGGSIPDHLHLHILPRFESDTGFISVLADTKVVSVDIIALYSELKKLMP